MIAEFIVIGASSPVGNEVVAQLRGLGRSLVATTRKTLPAPDKGVEWVAPGDLDKIAGHATPYAICVAHIWVVEQYLPALRDAGVRRLVALSTTSLFTKRSSGSGEEQDAWRLFEESERRVSAACAQLGIGLTILRPTLIYGSGRDKNIAQIARMIRRFGFFPLLGRACGKRQPISAGDVATATIQAVQSPIAEGRSYNISGGEVLTYREMVERVFGALGRRPRMPTVPLWLFRAGVAALRLLPRFRKWTPDMAIRMNQDQDFNHADARRDFGFAPRPFELQAADVEG